MEVFERRDITAVVILVKASGFARFVIPRQEGSARLLLAVQNKINRSKIQPSDASCLSMTKKLISKTLPFVIPRYEGSAASLSTIENKK